MKKTLKCPIPFDSIQSSPVRPSPARRRGAHQFVVNLACPFILLTCPQEPGVHMPRPAQLE